MSQTLTAAIIKRTLRVPVKYMLEPQQEYSDAISRQLDVALIRNGFKADAGVLLYLWNMHPSQAIEVSREIIEAVSSLIGSHVEHNTYFKDFPKNIPDTIEFWSQLIVDTYGDNETDKLFVNLLDLNGYGHYTHTYSEMVNAHKELVVNTKNKLRVLTLGESLQIEGHKLYFSLAESKIPANGDDLALLLELAEVFIQDKQPENIPVRENKAVINSVRLKNNSELLVDTVTDVLRLAALLSGGDVSLQENTKFKNFNLQERKALMAALEAVIGLNKDKLGDVFKHREQFKQLSRKLGISRFIELKNAQEVFRVAREKINLSFESKLEKAFKSKNNKAVISLLENNPGLFVRTFNRLLLVATIGDLDAMTVSLEKILPKVSTPVIIGLRQYLSNRVEQKTNRVFINRKGTGKVFKDEQPVLGAWITDSINALLDAEVTKRLPEATYIINPDILTVAIPLSNRQTASGIGIMPRGSTDTFNGEILRFFNYWRQKSERTDYDLSAVLLNEDFTSAGQLSYTNLRLAGGVHSGDITSAEHGASEFIDIVVGAVTAKYIVPQVNNFSGEDFDTVKESFFGYMERTEAEKGLPFEARTVKTKADMRGKNKVALPLVFIKEDDGTVTVKWLNAFLQGQFQGNSTENNTLNTSTLIRGIVETNYLTVNYLVDLLRRKPNTIVETGTNEQLLEYAKADAENATIVYIGKETLANLPKEIKVITLKNLHELL